jgi:hypothetical protein
VPRDVADRDRGDTEPVVAVAKQRRVDAAAADVHDQTGRAHALRAHEALVDAIRAVRVDVVDLPRRDQPAADDKSVIRSWIAMTLVFGLLIFCATAFVVGD